MTTDFYSAPVTDGVTVTANCVDKFETGRLTLASAFRIIPHNVHPDFRPAIGVGFTRERRP
jgi:hypothetical protein